MIRTAALPTRRYRADVLTDSYLFAGEIEPQGPLLNYLNDPAQATLAVRRCTVRALDASNTMKVFEHDEIHLARYKVNCIRLGDPVSAGTVRLMAHRAKLIVYTDRFVIQALFHVPSDVSVRDTFQSTEGTFAVASQAFLHPLIPPAHPVFRTAPLLLVNKSRICFFHAARA